VTLVFLALYLAAVLSIGVFSARRASRDEPSFYLADRSYGPWRGFVALAATTTGGSSTIVCAALIYRGGVSGIWLDLAGSIGLLLLGLFLAGRVRKTGATTLPEIAGRFWGKGARTSAAALVVLAEIAWFALLIEASQTILTPVFGIRQTEALILSAAVFIFYTAVGGQYAVIRTDFVQYGLMVAGILLLGTFFSLPHLRAALLPGSAGHLPPGALSFPTSTSFGWGQIFSWLVLIGLPHLVGGDIYSKLLSCRDESAARRAALGAAASKLLFGASVAAIALALKGRPGLAITDSSQALPRALLEFVPGALASFVVVALLATMQSSADSVLLTASTVSARDLFPGLVSRRFGIGVARALIPVYGILGLLLALEMREIVETLKLGYSVFAAGMILPILFGFFPRLWVPPVDAILAMLLGGATALLSKFWPALALSLDPVLAGTAVNLAILGAAIVRTRLSGRCPGDYLPERERTPAA
jgi:SSS family solute:Na+ symporter